jgi:predicted lipase
MLSKERLITKQQAVNFLFAHSLIRICSTLKMEALSSSETSVYFYWFIWHHSLEYVTFIKHVMQQFQKVRLLLTLTGILQVPLPRWSQDSAVGIATGYKLDDRGD